VIIERKWLGIQNDILQSKNLAKRAKQKI
jgi:hypothetical protein